MAASIVAGALVVGILSAPVDPHGQPVGYVKIVTGEAVIVRGGDEMSAHPGDALYQNDQLRTETDGHLGVTLKDDTRISLGPGAEIDLLVFKFSPAEGQLELVMKLLRGAAAFVTGRIAALRPEAVRIETPATIVGVRGTHVAILAGGP
jgi:hypothetical protein